MRSIVRAIYISRIFYIRDLRSGQFRDLPMLSQWAKFQLRLFRIGTFPKCQSVIKWQIGEMINMISRFRSSLTHQIHFRTATGALAFILPFLIAFPSNNSALRPPRARIAFCTLLPTIAEHKTLSGRCYGNLHENRPHKSIKRVKDGEAYKEMRN